MRIRMTLRRVGIPLRPLRGHAKMPAESLRPKPIFNPMAPVGGEQLVNQSNGLPHHGLHTRR